jgi:hypothetical protein
METYCLKIFSKASPDAEGSKLEPSTETACSKRALPLTSVGMSGVP